MVENIRSTIHIISAINRKSDCMPFYLNNKELRMLLCKHLKLSCIGLHSFEYNVRLLKLLFVYSCNVFALIRCYNVHAIEVV